MERVKRGGSNTRATHRRGDKKAKTTIGSQERPKKRSVERTEQNELRGSNEKASESKRRAELANSKFISTTKR